jgi:hypothetical protein
MPQLPYARTRPSLPWQATPTVSGARLSQMKLALALTSILPRQAGAYHSSRLANLIVAIVQRIAIDKIEQ